MKPAMASATLADIKTHTRRIVAGCENAKWEAGPCFIRDPGTHWNIGGKAVQCPYGGKGDQLWVRESYFEFGHWEPVEGVKTKCGRQKWRFVADSKEVFYKPVRAKHPVCRPKDNPGVPAIYKRLARFMPRALSRITLEITEIRIERLNDISADDCRAEGHPKSDRPFTKEAHDDAARDWYMDLWESINGPGSWAKNPLVWIIVFRRIAA